MAGIPADPELREALEELQQYLSDTLPPLVVADSIGLLLRYPPELMASNMHAWTASQYKMAAEIPLSDYLFHAVKKIHLMGEFHLVPKEPFEKYLTQLKEIVLTYCPEGDREFLRTNLGQLGEATTIMTSSVERIFRQTATADRPLAAGRATGSAAAGRLTMSVAPGEEQLMELRRVSLLLDRLERELSSGARPASGQAGGGFVSPTLAAAARSTHNTKELEQYLERLRSIGIDIGTGDLFRSLGSSLPGWTLPAPAGGAGVALPARENSAVEAMHRIVTEAEDPAEGARRFQEMVKTAVERFNEGSLAQAVTMLDLAERIIAERKVDPGMAEITRRKADESLDVERLRKYAEAPDQHALLRRVLNFFTALTPKGLLEDLRGEPKRERRRLLLLLLEIHGVPAREAALEQLRSAFGQAGGEDEWYFRRNLLYLLRRVPRASGVSPDEDVDIAIRHTELGLPTPLVKEAIANLGQLKHEKAERTLMTLLEDLETMLVKPADAPYEAKELRLLLDRVVAALARFGSPAAHRAVVDHGLKKQAALGDTMARLAELAGQDLSGDEELVERLLTTLKAHAPFKLFGLVLRQNDRNLYACIEALSTTPAPAVQMAFEDIVKRFPGSDVAKAAAEALASFAVAPAPAEAQASASLSGDLALFGLPALLQSLADSVVSGSLTLRDPKGEVFGTISLRGGKMKNCHTAKLLGEEAFYQLLERPVPGNFQFSRQHDGVEETSAGPLRDILPLSLEGMRRYDEFQQAVALVPDEVFLKCTSVKATPHPDEKDGILVKDLWTRVSQGATARDCEAEMRADSYRIRRLLAHWVEQGALQIQGTARGAGT